MSAPPAARAVYLAAGRDPVLGLFHEPAAGTPPRGAVLICPPFGWEEVCSYRSRREWACELARAGRPALRIDLPGTGDSGGGSRDPDLLEAWTRSVGEAAAWLQQASGEGPVTTLGIGLGGLLALRAAAGPEPAPIGDLVLWAVPARGRILVRQLRAFALLNEARDGPGDADPPAPEGHIETGGFLITPETIAALSAVDLAEVPLPGERRIMILERDGIEPDERLLAHLRGSGAELTTATTRGYGAMMAHPEEARPPVAAFEAVERWLADGSGGLPSRSTAGGIEGGGDWARIATPDGGAVLEAPITIEMPFGRLFGVLAEPVEENRADLCAVLLNAGALRRIGPGRMWVEIARRWAARGVPTLRLDIEGIGDADGDGRRYEDVAALYEPEFVDQVIAALDELERRGAPRRFLLAGLCSGAYWAFHAALRDERVQTAFLVNPRLLYWDEALLAKREVRKTKRLLERSSWRRILRGHVRPARFLELARWACVALLRGPSQLRGRRARSLQLDQALDTLRDAGKRILFVFGEREPLREELERDGRLQPGGPWPNLELELVAGHHHALEPITAQARVHAVLDRVLESELAKLDRRGEGNAAGNGSGGHRQGATGPRAELALSDRSLGSGGST